jgi:hypothetical protein
MNIMSTHAAYLNAVTVRRSAKPDCMLALKARDMLFAGKVMTIDIMGQMGFKNTPT